MTKHTVIRRGDARYDGQARQYLFRTHLRDIPTTRSVTFAQHTFARRTSRSTIRGVAIRHPFPGKEERH